MKDAAVAGDSDTRVTSLAPALARYWINEASALQDVSKLIDDTPNPVHLTLQYEPTSPVFGEGMGGGRYIRFAGRANVGSLMPIAGTKFEALNGATEVTIEIKLSVDACDVDTEQQRMFGFGDGAAASAGWLAVRAWKPNEISSVGLALTWTGRSDRVFYYPSACPNTTSVLHWIVDTGKALEEDRVRLFRDGIRLALNKYGNSGPGVWPPLDSTINLGPMTQTVHLGRATDGARTSGVRIFYVAVYENALTLAEVETHNDELQDIDD